MAIARHFLGWAGPALPQAVTWLADRYADPAGWDLSGLVIATPGGRAGRRLLELLTERADQRDAVLLPPKMCTLGELPDHLCPPPAQRRVAPESRAMLTWVRVLREIGGERLSELVPHPPRDEDIVGWWQLAEHLRDLHDDLAGGAMTIEDALSAHHAGRVDLSRPERWEALHAIDQAYHALLEADGLIDTQRHRLETMRNQRCEAEQDVVLVGAPDIGPLLGAMLRQVQRNVTALVHAPESHADGFDQLGALVTDYWAGQPVELDDDALRVVDRTSDQPAEVAAVIGTMNAQRGDGHALAPDQITIGLGDETQGGAIRRTLQRAGAPARTAVGRAFDRTPPAMLVAALATFAERYRLDAFADLVRHPDIAAYLRQTLDQEDAGRDWLTLLDEFISEYLRAELAVETSDLPRKMRPLAHAFHAVADLLPPRPEERRALPAWSPVISQALSEFYGQRMMSRLDPRDAEQIAAIQLIADALREHAQHAADHDVTPQVTLSQAMQLALAAARQRTIPAPGGDPAVELLGFLELPLDDAPAIVITSLNEGHLPAPPRADALLPDSLRGALGLGDAPRRLARDKLLLRAAIHGREHVALIAPRRAAEGDPLTPSRLLLACDEATRTRRIRRFYDNEAADPPRRYALLTHGERNRFLIPHPEHVEPEQPLSVTAFRDYLDCPYRFYLKHVRRLRSTDDSATELDAAQFGTVAHQALEAFAREGPTDSNDAARINDFLREALDEHFRRTFGTRLRPALHIQRQQLEERLAKFAEQQAILAGEGWRIAHAEQKVEATIDVDGRPFAISGKIDRIDVHDELGHRIIDYKTGDRGDTPQRTHRGKITRTHRPVEAPGEVGWVDLQLPLYLDLAVQFDVPRDAGLAYFNLPRKLEDVKLCAAEWTDNELSEAADVRDWVIRQLRARRYWPPQEAGPWPDEFTWLCADEALDRPGLIRASEAPAQGGGDADA